MLLGMVVMSSTRRFNFNWRIYHQVLVIICCRLCTACRQVIANLVAKPDVVGLSLLSNVVITFEEGLVLLLLLSRYLLLNVG